MSMPITSGNYVFDSLSLFLLLSGIAGIFVAYYISRFKSSPGSGYLALLQLFTSTWAIFYFLEYSSMVIETRILWSKLSYLAIPLIPVWFYLFAVNFESRQKTSLRGRHLPLLLLALFFTGMVMTNDFHHLHWKSFVIDLANSTTIYSYGPFFWLLYLFTYLLLTLGTIQIFRLLSRYANQIHEAMWLLILACVIPVLGNFMYVFKFNPIPGFDWTPTLFSVSGAILAYVNIRFGSIDLIPFARQKLIDVMGDGFLVLDTQNRIADCNQSFLNLLGKSYEQAIGKPIEEVIPYRLNFSDEFKAKKGALSLVVESQKSGTSKMLDVRSKPLFAKNNTCCGHIITIRDITKQKEQEAIIVETNQSLKDEITAKEQLIEDLDSFAHTVAHNLKGTVGAIVSLSEMIENDLDNNDFKSIGSFNQIINQSATKTLNVMEELLIMATIRQQHIRKESLEMANVINEALTRLDRLIEEGNATLSISEEWPVIQAVPSWIEEVWVNLISNAVKYGGNPPHIQLGADILTLENKVRFWVKDNGEGLSPEDQEKLFSKFTRLHISQAQGTGLGLSIVKRIIEKLDGEVGVNSDAIPGKGCCFYFILPLD